MASEYGLQSRDATLPPIAALFLVVFDRKVGYSIAWQRAVPGVELDGVVEYKSLPSGLHNVQSDLVYFVHEQYAGISAFVNHPADKADRNAHFATVGVLVPLTYGRLGRSWLHAEQLRAFAETVVTDIHDTDALQEYWDHNHISGTDEQSNGSHSDRRKRRALSDLTGPGPCPALSQDHPALSLPQDFDTFGPLVFPLCRAALLKKKILIMTSAPVRSACNIVYNLSVLSNLPPSVADVTETSEALHPVRPLFNVGIHDIAHLSQSRDSSDALSSWIACSTDDILETKTNLYDVLVTLPSAEAAAVTSTRQWPKVQTSSGQAIKATQRDLRRYYTLKREMKRVQRLNEAYHDEGPEQAIDDDESETALLNQAKSSGADEQDEYIQLEGEDNVAEASSWAAIAYSSFLWWASAGEKDALMEDEACQDARLMNDLPLPHQHNNSRPGSRKGGKLPSNGHPDEPEDESQSVAVMLIAYVQRLTILMMETLAEVLDAADAEGEGKEQQTAIAIQSEDMRRMGLDEWSEADGSFVKEVAALHFGREVNVQGRSVDLCGVKIC